MPQTTHSTPVRLAKFLAAAGLGSRRACETIITEGRVTVNGQTVTTPACNVTPGQDLVRFQGSPVSMPDAVTVMLNKPVGYTCTVKDPHARHSVFELLPQSLGRLVYVGRLDRDSEGLLLFTNDGNLAQHLTHPSFQVEKTYVVDCNGILTPPKISFLTKGFQDEGDFLRARSVRTIRARDGQVMAEFVLTEGKKREVRRMCARIGLEVVRLARTRFAGLDLGRLPTGECRRLTAQELQQLHNYRCK